MKTASVLSLFVLFIAAAPAFAQEVLCLNATPIMAAGGRVVHLCQQAAPVLVAPAPPPAPLQMYAPPAPQVVVVRETVVQQVPVPNWPVLVFSPFGPPFPVWPVAPGFSATVIIGGGGHRHFRRW